MSFIFLWFLICLIISVISSYLFSRVLRTTRFVSSSSSLKAYADVTATAFCGISSSSDDSDSDSESEPVAKKRLMVGDYQ
uniref:Putative secreted protein n=1 Tax=Ixodes ricinus TaxID=34613 RepID=A0A6B0U6B2_IXORI